VKFYPSIVDLSSYFLRKGPHCFKLSGLKQKRIDKGEDKGMRPVFFENKKQKVSFPLTNINNIDKITNYI